MELTPSYHGESCCFNGENPDYEIACDECPYYLVCFSDWEHLGKKYGAADPKSVYSIQTSCDEDLFAFLRSKEDQDGLTDREKEIILHVREELTRRGKETAAQ